MARRTVRRKTTKPLKAIIERHDDGYIAYPLGLKGVVVAQGDTYEDAVKDLHSAIRFRGRVTPQGPRHNSPRQRLGNRDIRCAGKP